MSLPVVVFLDRATIPAHITLPTLAFEHRWVEYDFTSPEQVIERLQEADIVITNKVLLNQAVLAQLPNLRMIAVAATGFNNVDVEYCAEQGIAVANVRGYATRSVPEHVIAMLFALRRNLFGYHQDIAAGVWQKDKQFCFFSPLDWRYGGLDVRHYWFWRIRASDGAVGASFGYEGTVCRAKRAKRLSSGLSPF